MLPLPKVPNCCRARWRADLARADWTFWNARICVRTFRIMTTNLLVFAMAAFFEIAGCFAFWTSLRRGASPFAAGLGIVGLFVSHRAHRSRDNEEAHGARRRKQWLPGPRVRSEDVHARAEPHCRLIPPDCIARSAPAFQTGAHRRMRGRGAVAVDYVVVRRFQKNVLPSSRKKATRVQ